MSEWRGEVTSQIKAEQRVCVCETWTDKVNAEVFFVVPDFTFAAVNDIPHIYSVDNMK